MESVKNIVIIKARQGSTRGPPIRCDIHLGLKPKKASKVWLDQQIVVQLLLLETTDNDLLPVKPGL